MANTGERTTGAEGQRCEPNCSGGTQKPALPIYSCRRVFIRHESPVVVSATTDVSGLLKLEEKIPKDKSV